jgi:hypothetical protein
MKTWFSFSHSDVFNYWSDVMKKRKPHKKQLDLFFNDPESMQWEDLSGADRKDIQYLLAQLLLSFFSHNELESQESRHAIEN